MNHVVRLTTNDDGAAVENPVWCLVDPAVADAWRTLCGGEVFGDAEGPGIGETKCVRRGGITCPTCLLKIKQYKAVKL
jgi:hypothetical protein